MPIDKDSEKKKHYTIYDVAKRAQVSPSTVSHVINGTAPISMKTQARIQNIIRELNYRPNANARALRQPQSNIIGVIFPDIASEYYAACTASIIHHAQQENYVVLTSSLHFDNKILAATLPALIERRVDGLIFIGGHGDEEYLRMAKEADVPVVLGDRYMQGFPCVEFNNFETMRRLTCSLYDAGYRRFAYVGEALSQQQNLEQRYNGYLAGMRERNVPQEDYFSLLSEELNLTDKMPTAYHQMLPFFQSVRGREQPQIILTSNDLIAQGVISAAARAGLRIPQDAAVFGFDNINLSAYSIPAISSVEQSPHVLGENCFSMLMQCMHGEACENRMLDQQIIVRESAPIQACYLRDNGLAILSWAEGDSDNNTR